MVCVVMPWKNYRHQERVKREEGEKGKGALFHDDEVEWRNKRVCPCAVNACVF
jgi:hypothetical protein